MNDIFNRSDLDPLMDQASYPSLSIYMPAHRISTHAQEDSIRLKNLLRQAENDLAAIELRTPEIRSLLEPAEQLLDNMDFWQNQSDGLALFLSQESSRILRLPLPFQESVTISKQYHIKPLLPLFANDGRYYLLALSQNQVRLWQGTKHNMDEYDLKGLEVPQSLAEALAFDDPEKELQFHTSTAPSPGAGRRDAMFFGTGASEDDTKSNLLRFFQKVDAGLQPFLRNHPAPLVLAGVDYLLPIYHEASHYSELQTEGIIGNPEHAKVEELHQRAWEIVSPLFQSEQEEATQRYHELAASGLASSNLEDVVPAAAYGRIEAAFVLQNKQQWGKFDPTTGKIELSSEPSPESQDLLDLVAVETLRKGGEVFAVTEDAMPSNAPVAALFRY